MSTRAAMPLPPASDLHQLQELDRRSRHMGYWFLAYLLLYPIPWLAQPPGLWDVLASAVGIAVFLPMYLAGFGRFDTRALGCGLGVALIGLALQPFGGIWGVFIVYACGLLGSVLPRKRACAALAGVAVAVATLVLVRELTVLTWLPTLFFSVMTAMISMYSSAYTAQSEALARSRDEARRLAVVAERERIARDLHDLLGHTLTAVAVKADLAGRLIDADPVRAKAEIEDIRRTARSALADVRAAVTGMRSARLATELATARRALDSAGITLSTEGMPPALAPAVETALAFVLLEGVTNVVRHAHAERCDVAFVQERETLLLRIRDSRDAGTGAEGPPGRPAALPEPPAAAEGHGIWGMRQRLAAVGGTLTLESGAQGTTLLARVPRPDGVAA